VPYGTKLDSRGNQINRSAARPYHTNLPDQSVLLSCPQEDYSSSNNQYLPTKGFGIT
jgi:hypothetical protein